MNTRTLILSLFTVVPCLQAEPLTFDFKDPKGVNNAVFVTDAPLESINGTASGISGTLTIDPANPEKATGKIVVATDSVKVTNPMMQEHLVGKEWLNAKEYPEITFEPVSAANVKREGEKGTADVTGKFTLKGVTKEITVPVTVHYLPGKLKDRQKVDGDLLVIRTKFDIKRSDFNIKPGEFTDKVADEINLTLSIAGAAPKK